MTKDFIYTGEDFYLIIEDQDQEVNLADYHLELQLSTSSPATKIVASTREDAEILIERTNDYSFMVHIPSSVTSQLHEGVMMLSIMLENTLTDEKSIAEVKTIEVKQSKGNF